MIRRQQIAVVAVLAFVSAQPLIWFSLVRGEGFSVKPVHLAFAAVLGGALLAWGRQVVRWPKRGLSAAFFVLFAAYLVWCWSTLIWSPSVAGFVAIGKDTVYFAMFLILYGSWRNMQMQDKNVVGVWGAAAGCLMFLAVAELTFAQQGRHFLIEYVQAAVSRDLVALQFGFYPKLFNAAAGGETLTRDDANFISTSLRNTLVGAFVLYFFLTNAYRQNRRRRGSLRLAASWIFGGLSLILVVLSVSRSNWLALALGIAAVSMSAYFKNRRRGASSARRGIRLSTLLILMSAIAACLLLAVVSAEALVSVLDVVAARVSQIGDDPRLAMIRESMKAIGDRPLTGYGIGATLSGSIGVVADDMQIHNLFLAAWYEAGYPGFVIAVGFYVVLLVVWARHVISGGRGDEAVVRAQIWVSGLPALPLVRMMVGGGGGGLSLIDMTCLAIFLAEYVRATSAPAPESSPTRVSTMHMPLARARA